MMKKTGFFLFICMQIGQSFAEESTVQENHIIVVVVAQNSQKYIQRTLESVLNQNYSNYILLVIDDCSQDNTIDFVKGYGQDRGQSYQLVVHKNKVRRNVPLINYLRAAKVSASGDIIVVLSPQDYFAHDEVLADLNNIYQSDDVWMTYGPTRCYPSRRIIYDQQIPKEVIALKGYRDYLNTPAYLHSFRAGLFKKIEIYDFCYSGNFLKMDNDLAAMFPMLEMAKNHARYVSNVLIVHNTQLDHHRYMVEKEHQELMDVTIRCRLRYDELEHL